MNGGLDWFVTEGLQGVAGAADKRGISPKRGEEGGITGTELSKNAISLLTNQQAALVCDLGQGQCLQKGPAD